MIRYCFYLSALTICFLAESTRDPFSYADDHHSLCCVSIGVLNNEFFGRIYEDGVISTVRLHERYGEFQVTALTENGITLKDSAGMYHLLMFASETFTKKSPST